MGEKQNKLLSTKKITKKLSNNIVLILLLFVACSIVKDIEFIFIKTDQTILAENIICKLFCIAVLVASLFIKKIKFNAIGFKLKGFLRAAFFGIFLGVVTFSISYFVEFLILKRLGKTPHLECFITNFALSSQNVKTLSISAIGICVFGNLINVFAEEGLFRGLFLHLGKENLGFKKSNLLQGLLFGAWHLVSVFIWVLDGSLSVFNAIIFGIGYFLLALCLAYEWGLCLELTGCIWAGCFEHFINNFSSNFLHTVTQTGIDEMQIVRITLSNILSLLIVLFFAKRKR